MWRIHHSSRTRRINSRLYRVVLFDRLGAPRWHELVRDRLHEEQLVCRIAPRRKTLYKWPVKVMIPLDAPTPAPRPGVHAKVVTLKDNGLLLMIVPRPHPVPVSYTHLTLPTNREV